MGKLRINKSGQQVPVWQVDTPCTNPVQVGTLYDGEAFILGNSNGIYQYINFRNSSGVVSTGCFLDYSLDDRFTLPANIYTSPSEYPYRTVTLSGTTYNVYKLRRDETIRNTAGVAVGTVASGNYVATTSDTTGETYCDHLLVYYIGNTSGVWVSQYSPHCFVDIGLSDGSMPYDISMYGTW